MDFYTILSDVYDDLFPAEPSILRFLTDTFSSCQRVLDVACGTGTYTIPLWEQGKDVVGIDLSLPMIEQARGKLQKMFGRLAQGTSDKSPTTPQGRETDFPKAPADIFQIGDMQDLSRIPPGSFQGLYCIGNSLPHLDSESQIRLALKQFLRVLSPGGVLLLQTINFDRVRFDHSGRFALPTLKGRRAELARFYTSGSDSDHLYFESELSLPDGKRMRNRIPLFLLTRNRLEAWLQDAGFGSQMWYGSYERKAYEPDTSFLSIVVARVRGT